MQQMQQIGQSRPSRLIYKGKILQDLERGVTPIIAWLAKLEDALSLDGVEEGLGGSEENFAV